MSENVVEIPLFPLRTVLFPGGMLPLRIFEPRYVDMVSRCMREQIGFGVVLIRHGVEARGGDQPEQPDCFSMGTEAKIVDFNMADSGLLGIVAEGRRKFVVHATHEQSDHLLLGQVEFLPAEPRGELLDEHRPLIDLLGELAEHPLVQKLNLKIDFGDARCVSQRLAELLPIEPEIKQSLLQIRWPRERLNELTRIVRKFQQ